MCPCMSVHVRAGRLRYEGKAVAQASKLVSYAAIGMVVASVEAVEHGHAEEAEGEWVARLETRQQGCAGCANDRHGVACTLGRE